MYMHRRLFLVSYYKCYVSLELRVNAFQHLSRDETMRQRFSTVLYLNYFGEML
jgi:hypothetical protein